MRTAAKVSTETTEISISLTRDLRERARVVEKRLRSSLRQLVRDALTEKVEIYEAKFKAEDAERRAENKKYGRRGRELHSMGSMASSGERAEARIDEKLAESTAPVEDPLQAIYAEQAKRILPVINNAWESRTRTMEAVAAVKKAAPLMHPLNDSEIVVALQREVLKLRAQMPTLPTEPAPAVPPAATFEERLLAQEAARAVTRFLDDNVGRVLDPSRVRTAGDAK